MFLTELYSFNSSIRLTNCGSNRHHIFPLSGEKHVRPKSVLDLLLHYTNLRRGILSIPVNAYSSEAKEKPKEKP
jgi:hypothetical protein